MQTHRLWPTLVLTKKIEDLDFVRWFKNFQPRASQGRRFNLFDLRGEHHFVERLFNEFEDFGKEWLKESEYGPEYSLSNPVSNVVRYGFAEYVTPHVHRHSDLILIFYAAAGVKSSDPARTGVIPINQAPERAGALVLIDPRGHQISRAKPSESLFSIYPEDGLLVAFPGYLFHQTTPHLGSESRIAINCNFAIEKAGSLW